MTKKACCQDATNLDRSTDPGRPDVVIRICRVCGARHITLRADPGRLGLSGAALE
jgi:hypothetical protein